MACKHCAHCSAEKTTTAATKAPAKMTPARAVKMRRAAMVACGCQMCRWAMEPATTFAEHEARMGRGPAPYTREPSRHGEESVSIAA